MELTLRIGALCVDVSFTTTLLQQAVSGNDEMLQTTLQWRPRSQKCANGYMQAGVWRLHLVLGPRSCQICHNRTFQTAGQLGCPQRHLHRCALAAWNSALRYVATSIITLHPS